MRLPLILTLIAVSPPALADVFTFETPSGNIDCTVGLGFDGLDIECMIYARASSPAVPGLAQCGAGGHVFSMLNRGPVAVGCAQFPNSAAQDIAEYGVTGQFDGITCPSQSTGFQCTNADGHGFFLSRRMQQVY